MKWNWAIGVGFALFCMLFTCGMLGVYKCVLEAHTQDKTFCGNVVSFWTENQNHHFDYYIKGDFNGHIENVNVTQQTYTDNAKIGKPICFKWQENKFKHITTFEHFLDFCKFIMIIDGFICLVLLINLMIDHFE